MTYADASALAKVVLQEDGSSEIRRLVGSGEVIISATVGYAEIRAAVAAAVRDGRLPARDEEAVSQIDDLWLRVDEIIVDQPLVRRAGDLAERFALRGYDAVHLAALMRVGGPEDIAFACWDSDLRRAANGLGYTLLPL